MFAPLVLLFSDGIIAFKVGPAGDLATSSKSENKAKAVSSGFYTWYQGMSQSLYLSQTLCNIAFMICTELMTPPRTTSAQYS